MIDNSLNASEETAEQFGRQSVASSPAHETAPGTTTQTEALSASNVTGPDDAAPEATHSDVGAAGHAGEERATSASEAPEPGFAETAGTSEHSGHDEPAAQAAAELPAEEAPPADEAEVESVTPLEEITEPEGELKKDWYILKVQSNREESIREGLQRRVAVAGLQKYFGDVIVPTEMVTEFKGGKRRVVKRKLYPGYIVVHMAINEDTWFLVRETPGIGDFTGSAGKPTPMAPHEVQRIIVKQEEKGAEAPKLKINFRVGDRIKINEGTFENFEGEVDSIDEASGRVTVMINIFGRSTPVELEYWQIEAI